LEQQRQVAEDVGQSGWIGTGFNVHDNMPALYHEACNAGDSVKCRA